MSWEESKYTRQSRLSDTTRANKRYSVIRIAILISGLIAALVLIRSYITTPDNIPFDPKVHEHYSKLTATLEYKDGQTKVTKIATILPTGSKPLFEKYLAERSPTTAIPQSTPAEGQSPEPPLPPLGDNTSIKLLETGEYELTTVETISSPLTTKDGVSALHFEMNKATWYTIAAQEYTLSIPYGTETMTFPAIKLAIRPFAEADPKDHRSPTAQELSIQYTQEVDVLRYTIRLNKAILPGEQVLLDVSWKQHVEEVF